MRAKIGREHPLSVESVVLKKEKKKKTGKILVVIVFGKIKTSIKYWK